MFKLMAILASILLFDLLQVFRLPVKAHEPADKEFRTVFTRFIDGLVKEKRITDGPVQNAVEDVGEGFTLFVLDRRSVTSVKRTRGEGIGKTYDKIPRLLNHLSREILAIRSLERPKHFS